MQKKRLGEILLERGVIDADQLESALAFQKQWGHRLGVALVAKGFITESTLVRVLGEVLGFPVVDLATERIDSRALQVVPARVAKTHDVFPVRLLAESGRTCLLLAMGDPTNVAAHEELGFITGHPIQPAIAAYSAIISAIRHYYDGEQTSISPLQGEEVSSAGDDTLSIVYTGDEEEVPVEVDEEPVIEGECLSAAEEQPGLAAFHYGDLRTLHAQRTRSEPVSSPKPAARAPAFVPTPAAPRPEQADRGLDAEQVLQSTDRKLRALLRVLVRKGLVSKEDLLRELREMDK